MDRMPLGLDELVERWKKGHGNTYAKRIAVLAAYAAANTDTFLGERFRRLASRPGGGGRKKAGCAVGRSILVISLAARSHSALVVAVARRPSRVSLMPMATRRGSISEAGTPLRWCAKHH
jgi:hypothetical protein